VYLPAQLPRGRVRWLLRTRTFPWVQVAAVTAAPARFPLFDVPTTRQAIWLILIDGRRIETPVQRRVGGFAFAAATKVGPVLNGEAFDQAIRELDSRQQQLAGRWRGWSAVFDGLLALDRDDPAPAVRRLAADIDDLQVSRSWDTEKCPGRRLAPRRGPALDRSLWTVERRRTPRSSQRSRSRSTPWPRPMAYREQPPSPR
jgi:hypothetical protein